MLTERMGGFREGPPSKRERERERESERERERERNRRFPNQKILLRVGI